MNDGTRRDATTARAMLGLVLCRVVVPLWILTGALFKLAESNPALLPRNILTAGDRAGIDLDALLAILITLEVFAAAVIILLPRLAKAMAIFMLSIFCLVLIGEIAAGRTSCGCLGGFSPPPWLMLAIDGGLLLGVILLAPRGTRPRGWWPVAATVAATVVAAAACYVVIIRQEVRTLPAITADADDGPRQVQELDPRVTAAAPPALPSYWYASDLDAWIGKRVEEIDLFGFLGRTPKSFHAGTRYVVFYGRTCDHCETMFTRDLAPDPTLAAQVTAIEVPYEAVRLRSADAWPLPETTCELLELPLGVNWIITTPLAVRLEDGVIRCVTEGEHETCLELKRE